MKNTKQISTASFSKPRRSSKASTSKSTSTLVSDFNAQLPSTSNHIEIDATTQNADLELVYAGSKTTIPTRAQAPGVSNPPNREAPWLSTPIDDPLEPRPHFYGSQLYAYRSAQIARRSGLNALQHGASGQFAGTSSAGSGAPRNQIPNLSRAPLVYNSGFSRNRWNQPAQRRLIELEEPTTSGAGPSPEARQSQGVRRENGPIQYGSSRNPPATRRPIEVGEPTTSGAGPSQDAGQNQVVRRQNGPKRVTFEDHQPYRNAPPTLRRSEISLASGQNDFDLNLDDHQLDLDRQSYRRSSRQSGPPSAPEAPEEHQNPDSPSSSIRGDSPASDAYFEDEAVPSRLQSPPEAHQSRGASPASDIAEFYEPKASELMMIPERSESPVDRDQRQDSEIPSRGGSPASDAVFDGDEASEADQHLAAPPSPQMSPQHPRSPSPLRLPASRLPIALPAGAYLYESKSSFMLLTTDPNPSPIGPSFSGFDSNRFLRNRAAPEEPREQASNPPNEDIFAPRPVEDGQDAPELPSSSKSLLAQRRNELSALLNEPMDPMEPSNSRALITDPEVLEQQKLALDKRRNKLLSILNKAPQGPYDQRNLEADQNGPGFLEQPVNPFSPVKNAPRQSRKRGAQDPAPQLAKVPKLEPEPEPIEKKPDPVFHTKKIKKEPVEVPSPVKKEPVEATKTVKREPLMHCRTPNLASLEAQRARLRKPEKLKPQAMTLHLPASKQADSTQWVRSDVTSWASRFLDSSHMTILRSSKLSGPGLRQIMEKVDKTPEDWPVKMVYNITMHFNKLVNFLNGYE